MSSPDEYYKGENSGVGNGALASRNTYVGLSGDFGTFLMGRHDTPYKMAGSADLFADTLADAQDFNGIIDATPGYAEVFFDYRAPNAVAYISPNLSGLTLAGAVISDAPYGSDLAGAYSLAALYANGPFSLNAAYENHDEIARVGWSGNDQEYAWKLSTGYTMDALTLGATVERQHYDTGYGNTSRTNWLVSAAYGMGPVTWAAQFGRRGDSAITVKDEDDSLNRFTLGMIYSLSKRTSIAVAYNHDKYHDYYGDGTETSAATFQLNHDF